jgi:hypothetical protein
LNSVKRANRFPFVTVADFATATPGQVKVLAHLLLFFIPVDEEITPPRNQPNTASTPRPNLAKNFISLFILTSSSKRKRRV